MRLKTIAQLEKQNRELLDILQAILPRSFANPPDAERIQRERDEYEAWRRGWEILGTERPWL